MFGYNIKQIAKGFYNNIANKEEELYLKRIAICRKCPLFTMDKFLGAICDDKKYINEKTREISRIPIDGWAQGCGCMLNKKARVPEAECIIDKW